MTFEHIATTLQQEKKLIYTAQSARNFHLRMLICKHVFEQGAVPINPFNLFGYYLYELVDRNLVRNGNNNIMKKCDELWAFGEISNGVLAEIKMFKQAGKPVRYFDIKKLPEVKEIPPSDAQFEEDVKEFRNLLLE